MPEKYIKITYGLSEKQANLSVERIEALVRIFPDKDKQIYITQEEEDLICKSVQNLVGSLFAENKKKAIAYLPVDTKFIERFDSKAVLNSKVSPSIGSQKYLEITCRITNHYAASFDGDKIGVMSIFPDKDATIDIAQRDKIEIERVSKYAIIALFAENKASVSSYFALDTKSLYRRDRPAALSESQQFTLAKLTLDTRIVIPALKRSHIERNKRNKASKLIRNIGWRFGLGIFLTGLAWYGANIFLRDNLIKADERGDNKVFATTYPDPIIRPRNIKKTLKPINLDYLKNDAISYLLSQNREIAQLAIREDTVAIAAKDRLLITNINGYSQQKNINLKGINPSSVAIANDGKIAIGTKSGTIIILSETGLLLQEFKQSYQILSLDFTTDSSRIVSANSAGEMEIFSLISNEKILAIFGHNGAVNKLLVTENKIVSAGSDNTIRVWDFQGKELKIFQDNNEVFSLAVSQDENYIYSGNSRGIIRKWDYKTEKEIDSYSWQNQKISSLVIVKNLLISGSNDRSVMVMSLSDRNNRKIFLNLGSYINSVAVAPDGKSIFVANRDGVNVLENVDK